MALIVYMLISGDFNWYSSDFISLWQGLEIRAQFCLSKRLASVSTQFNLTLHAQLRRESGPGSQDSQNTRGGNSVNVKSWTLAMWKRNGTRNLAYFFTQLTCLLCQLRLDAGRLDHKTAKLQRRKQLLIAKNWPTYAGILLLGHFQNFNHVSNSPPFPFPTLPEEKFKGLPENDYL